jgi:DNA-binding XRE family transcriptional regulator
MLPALAVQHDDSQDAQAARLLCACSKEDLAARILALEQAEARARAELGATQAELARTIHERDRFEALYRERCRRAQQEPLFTKPTPAARQASPLAHLEALGEVWACRDEIIDAAAKRANKPANTSAQPMAAKAQQAAKVQP